MKYFIYEVKKFADKNFESEYVKTYIVESHRHLPEEAWYAAMHCNLGERQFVSGSGVPSIVWCPEDFKKVYIRLIAITK
jgi:hypothetical protein